MSMAVLRGPDTLVLPCLSHDFPDVTSYLTSPSPGRPVMSMSESGLANRIKAIERACGQHAVARLLGIEPRSTSHGLS